MMWMPRKTSDLTRVGLGRYLQGRVHGVGVWVGGRERGERERGVRERGRERQEVTSPWHSTPPPHTLGYITAVPHDGWDRVRPFIERGGARQQVTSPYEQHKQRSTNTRVGLGRYFWSPCPSWPRSLLPHIHTCRVQGAGFRGSGFRVQGSGVQGAGCRVQGSGFRVQGFRVQGAGCRGHLAARARHDTLFVEQQLLKTLGCQQNTLVSARCQQRQLSR